VDRKISLQRLSKRQVRTYAQENSCFLDPSLNCQTPNNLLFVFDKTYRCANEKILAVSKNGTGNLYHSINGWQADLRELIDLGEREPVHILYNQIPSQERFITEIPLLISNLAKELELDPSELDKTLDSLLAVDRAVSNKNRQMYIDNSNKRILGSLIAYIGETIRIAINGEWKITQHSGAAWEPIIIDPNGKASSLCILVFDELYEAEESSFYDIALMLVEAQ
jgi:hypothetical protein